MKRLLFAAVMISGLLGLTACDKLDVIGDQSEKSFQTVLTSLSSKVTEDTEFGGWAIQSPDQEVNFEWSKDFSKTSPYDVKMSVNAQPFLAAGLDPAKLPEGMMTDNRLIVGSELGDDSLTYIGEASPLDSYKKLVKKYRRNITYHAALDHFGVNLGNGNGFEWAKDMKTNDKDIVFVLNPEPLLNAGVDPKKVKGWVYATVETMDENGKAIKVDKFLKPFDVES